MPPKVTVDSVIDDPKTPVGEQIGALQATIDDAGKSPSEKQAAREKKRKLEDFLINPAGDMTPKKEAATGSQTRLEAFAKSQNESTKSSKDEALNLQIEQARKEAAEKLSQSTQQPEKSSTERAKQLGLNESLSNEKFKNLSEGQRLLAIEQRSQTILRHVKETGEARFKEKMANLKWYQAPQKIWKSVLKDMWISKEEKEVLRETKTGVGEIKTEEWETIVDHIADMNLDITTVDGKAYIHFAKAEADADEEIQKATETFNRAANEYARIPKKWGDERLSEKNFTSYTKSKELYESARDKLLETEGGVKKDAALFAKPEKDLTKEEKAEKSRQSMNAMLRANERDMDVWALQAKLENPDADKALKKIESELEQGRLFNSKILWTAAYAGSGILARKTLKYGLGFWAAPVVGGALGVVRGWRKGGTKINAAYEKGQAAETREERRNTAEYKMLAAEILPKIQELDREAAPLRAQLAEAQKQADLERTTGTSSDIRTYSTENMLEAKIGQITKQIDTLNAQLRGEQSRGIGSILLGKEYAGKEVAAFVDADVQINRLRALITQYKMNETTTDVRAKSKAEIAEQIGARVKFIMDKKESGLLNFGKENPMVKEYELINMMAEAGMNISINEPLDERRETLLSMIQTRVEDELASNRKNIMTEEVVRGVLMGGTIATTSAYIKDWFPESWKEAIHEKIGAIINPVINEAKYVGTQAEGVFSYLYNGPLKEIFSSNNGVIDERSLVAAQAIINAHRGVIEGVQYDPVEKFKTVYTALSEGGIKSDQALGITQALHLTPSSEDIHTEMTALRETLPAHEEAIMMQAAPAPEITQVHTGENFMPKAAISETIVREPVAEIATLEPKIMTHINGTPELPTTPQPIEASLTYPQGPEVAEVATPIDQSFTPDDMKAHGPMIGHEDVSSHSTTTEMVTGGGEHPAINLEGIHKIQTEQLTQLKTNLGEEEYTKLIHSIETANVSYLSDENTIRSIGVAESPDLNFAKTMSLADAGAHITSQVQTPEATLNLSQAAYFKSVQLENGNYRVYTIREVSVENIHAIEKPPVDVTTPKTEGYSLTENTQHPAETVVPKQEMAQPVEAPVPMHPEVAHDAQDVWDSEHRIATVDQAHALAGIDGVVEPSEGPAVNGVAWNKWNESTDDLFENGKHLQFDTYSEYEKEKVLQQLFGRGYSGVEYVESLGKNAPVVNMEYFRESPAWKLVEKMPARYFFNDFKDTLGETANPMMPKEIPELVKLGLVRDNLVTTPYGEQIHSFTFHNRDELYRLSRAYARIDPLNAQPFKDETMNHYVGRMMKGLNQANDGTYWTAGHQPAPAPTAAPAENPAAMPSPAKEKIVGIDAMKKTGNPFTPRRMSETSSLEQRGDWHKSMDIRAAGPQQTGPTSAEARGDWHKDKGIGAQASEAEQKKMKGINSIDLTKGGIIPIGKPQIE